MTRLFFARRRKRGQPGQLPARSSSCSQRLKATIASETS